MCKLPLYIASNMSKVTSDLADVRNPVRKPWLQNYVAGETKTKAIMSWSKKVPECAKCAQNMKTWWWVNVSNRAWSCLHCCRCHVATEKLVILNKSKERYLQRQSVEIHNADVFCLFVCFVFCFCFFNFKVLLRSSYTIN